MREEFNNLEQYRSSHPLMPDTQQGDDYGFFIVDGPSGQKLSVISSGADMGWEHVSVSLKDRCPNWQEMCFIKDLFWSAAENVMQLHPAKEDYVNNHEYCLHLWRPTNQNIPTPPVSFV